MTTINQIGSGLSGSTGTGTFVGSSSPSISSPTLTTPTLGTPASGTLTNCLGLPGASHVFLSSQTAAASPTISFTSVITNTYNTYMLQYYNVVPTTNASNMGLQFSINNGSSYVSTGYEAGLISFPYNSTTASNSNSTSNIPLGKSGSSLSTNPPLAGIMYFFNLTNGNVPSVVTYFSQYTTAGPTFVSGSGGGTNTTTNTINAIQISSSAGNIGNGTFVLYGIRESN